MVQAKLHPRPSPTDQSEPEILVNVYLIPMPSASEGHRSTKLVQASPNGDAVWRQTFQSYELQMHQVSYSTTLTVCVLSLLIIIYILTYMNGEQPSTSLQAKEHHLQSVIIHTYMLHFDIIATYLLFIPQPMQAYRCYYKRAHKHSLHLHVHCCTVLCPCTTDTSWCTSCMWLPSLWCLASGQPLLNLSLTPFPALSYHTQLMHTDLQVVVWEYSQDTEYKFLGEVSIPNRYISIQFMVHQIYVSSHLYNLPR